MTSLTKGLPVTHQLRGNFFRRRTRSKRSSAESIPPFRDLLSRARRSSRDPNGRRGLLQRPWQQGDVFIVVELPVVRKAILRPGSVDDLQAFPETLFRRFCSNVKPGKLMRLIASTCPKTCSSVTDQVKRSYIFS